MFCGEAYKHNANATLIDSDSFGMAYACFRVEASQNYDRSAHAEVVCSTRWFLKMRGSINTTLHQCCAYALWHRLLRLLRLSTARRGSCARWGATPLQAMSSLEYKLAVSARPAQMYTGSSHFGHEHLRSHGRP